MSSGRQRIAIGGILAVACLDEGRPSLPWPRTLHDLDEPYENQGKRRRSNMVRWNGCKERLKVERRFQIESPQHRPHPRVGTCPVVSGWTTAAVHRRVDLSKCLQITACMLRPAHGCEGPGADAPIPTIPSNWPTRSERARFCLSTPPTMVPHCQTIALSCATIQSEHREEERL